jgi:hypothetical protein
MEIGGLMSEAFKVMLGNPDILSVLLTFTVFVSVLLTLITIIQK